MAEVVANWKEPAKTRLPRAIDVGESRGFRSLECPRWKRVVAWLGLADRARNRWILKRLGKRSRALAECSRAQEYVVITYWEHQID